MSKADLHLSRNEIFNLFHYIEARAKDSDIHLVRGTLIKAISDSPDRNLTVCIPNTVNGFDVLYKYYKEFYHKEV